MTLQITATTPFVQHQSHVLPSQIVLGLTFVTQALGCATFALQILVRALELAKNKKPFTSQGGTRIALSLTKSQLKKIVMLKPT
jgi:hypothetical protein